MQYHHNFYVAICAVGPGLRRNNLIKLVIADTADALLSDIIIKLLVGSFDL